MPENAAPHVHVRTRHRPWFALATLAAGCAIIAFLLLMLNTLSPAFTLLDQRPGQYSGAVSAFLIVRLAFGVLPYAAAIITRLVLSGSTRTSPWGSWIAAGIVFCATAIVGLMISAVSAGGF